MVLFFLVFFWGGPGGGAAGAHIHMPIAHHQCQCHQSLGTGASPWAVLVIAYD
jgi:hypothetical protein